MRTAVALEPQLCRAGFKEAADESDPSMALADQVPGREEAADEVVATDNRMVPAGAVHQDEGNTPLVELIGERIIQCCGCQDQAVDATVEEHVDELARHAFL